METVEIDEMYRLEDHHWWFVGKRHLVDALLADALPAGPLRLLDVGCGTGAMLAHLGRRARAIGVDRSLRALAYCRHRGLTALACAEGDRLPFAPGSFDAVLLLDALEHFVDEAALLGSVRPLLRPGGSLLVSVPAYQFMWSAHDEALHHVRRYTRPTLRRVLERSGFAVQRLTYTNVAALPPAFLARAVLARLGLSRRPGSDLGPRWEWLNRAWIGVYWLEARTLRRIRRLPFGLSVAALATAA
jgi:SAM-dependent methyltransferase